MSKDKLQGWMLVTFVILACLFYPLQSIACLCAFKIMMDHAG